MPIGGTGHARRGYIGVCRCISGVLVPIGVYLGGTLGQPSSTNPNGGLLGAALWPWGSLALGMLLRFPPSLGPPYESAVPGAQICCLPRAASQQSHHIGHLLGAGWHIRHLGANSRAGGGGFTPHPGCQAKGNPRGGA